jgi:hypothetical protein
VAHSDQVPEELGDERQSGSEHLSLDLKSRLRFKSYLGNQEADNSRRADVRKGDIFSTRTLIDAGENNPTWDSNDAGTARSSAFAQSMGNTLSGATYPWRNAPLPQLHSFPASIMVKNEPNPPGDTLYVGNLPSDAQEEELKVLFSM